MGHWFSSDGGYYSNVSVSPFVFKQCRLSQNLETLQKDTFKFCITQVLLTADEVSIHKTVYEEIKIIFYRE